MISSRADGRLGFALIGVLWVIVAVSTLVLAARLVARESVQAAMNRRELERTRWVAEGCVARARAAAVRAQSEALHRQRDSVVWGRLDVELLRSLLVRGCDLHVRAVGGRLDANGADGASLRRLFAAAGLRRGQADSLADALLDWRDEDDLPRTFGAETAAYRAAGEPLPRNGPLRSRKEMLRIRGFGSAPEIDSLLDVEPGSVALNHAPFAVLATLPGVSTEAARAILGDRVRGGYVPSLEALQPRVSTEAWAQIVNRYAELAQRTMITPERWIVSARAGEAGSALSTEVEEAWVAGAGRPIVVRHRIGTDAW